MKMERILIPLIAALTLVGASPASESGLTEKKVLSLAGAKAVAAAAAAEAKKTNSGGAIAVVDDGGSLLYLERLDGTFPAAANISIGKARSAATFRRETSVFEDAIKNGRTSLVANPDLLPLQGGVPILSDGQVVGAIGVAGAASAQADTEIARAGSSAFK
jgi:glc operon protein GlcG